MGRIFEQAKALIEGEVLCDRCLGRCFARLGRGLSNEERGRALRVIIAMLQGSELRQVEPKECTICRGLFEAVEDWAERARERARDYEFQSYLVGTRVSKELEEAERTLWELYEISQEQAEPIRQEFNREVGKLLGRKLAEEGRDVEVEFRDPEVVLLLDLERGELELRISPIFIYGRYRKLLRGIPQTKWPCRRCRGRGCAHCDYTGKQYQESVEELIAAPIMEAAQAEGHAFHGAGREDIDALMLGKGRPFVLEIQAPHKRSLNLEALEDEINRYARGKVEVSGLRFVKRRVVEEIKGVEARKTYRAKVLFERPIGQKELDEALLKLVGEISQRTPRRVSHRRADLVRTRRVFAIEGELIGPNGASIELTCEGGLYVKELISGDGGRTHPSLAELLRVGAKVVELDVLEVQGDFPD